MSADSSLPVTLVVTLLALAFVLVIAWLALKLLAQSGKAALGGRAGRLKVLQSVAVGARERVVLLEVDGETMLLGVAAGSVRRLDTMPQAGKDATDSPVE